MVIETVKLKNFRNYGELDLTLHGGVNLFTGKNAQGKTNLLESVYLCCIGRSFKGKDRELIRAGADFFRVSVSARKAFGGYTVEIFLSAEDKKVLINGIPVLKMGELLGGINAVFFSPDELKLVKDAPVCRRKFMDIDLSQINKNYFFALKKYNGVLLQRNNLLKNHTKSYFSLLDIYDTQLAEEGAYLIKERTEFLRAVAGDAERLHSYITDGEKLSLGYQCSFAADGTDRAALSAAFLAALKKSLEKDIKFGYTTVGPHRDDIGVFIDGFDVRTYGSQGQQRTAALSMKLSELSFFKAVSGEDPVLLLDDVFSELDGGRRRRLLELCEPVQTLITSTEPTEPGRSIFTFNVKDGQIDSGQT